MVGPVTTHYYALATNYHCHTTWLEVHRQFSGSSGQILIKQYFSTNMLTRNALPLIDLSKSLNSTASSRLQHALLSFGAFRLAVPPSIQHLSEDVFKQASRIVPFIQTSSIYHALGPHLLHTSTRCYKAENTGILRIRHRTRPWRDSDAQRKHLFLTKKWHAAGCCPASTTSRPPPLCNVVIQSATSQHIHVHQSPQLSLANQFLSLSGMETCTTLITQLFIDYTWLQHSINRNTISWLRFPGRTLLQHPTPRPQ